MVQWFFPLLIELILCTKTVLLLFYHVTDVWVRNYLICPVSWSIISYALDYDQLSHMPWIMISPVLGGPTPCRINDVVSPVCSPSQPLSPGRPALGAHVNWTESLFGHSQVIIVYPMKYTHVYAVYCYIVLWLSVWCGFVSSIYPYPPVLFDWHWEVPF